MAATKAFNLIVYAQKEIDIIISAHRALIHLGSNLKQLLYSYSFVFAIPTFFISFVEISPYK